MTHSDAWQRRHALQLSGQLPDNYADGLGHMRLIWDHPHLGDDGGASVPIALVPKPPQRESPETSRHRCRDGPEPWYGA
jgi:hypothetical protein